MEPDGDKEGGELSVGNEENENNLDKLNIYQAKAFIVWNGHKESETQFAFKPTRVLRKTLSHENNMTRYDDE